MGNRDGLTESMSSIGTNKLVKFKGGYFSFAHGDEIALVLDKNKDEYFILNCDEELFEEVKKKVDSKATIEELKKFWIKKSKDYEVSDWSADFKLLK